jgi:hypothetical protein
MIVGLLWIIGCYAVSILLVHWCYRRDRQKVRKIDRIWVITNNNQMQVEGFVRYFHFSSWLQGKDIRMTLVDEGSTDETLAIAERLRCRYLMEIRNHNGQETLEEWVHGGLEEGQAMVVRLSESR